jgi:predicted extracellular nuclease
MKTNIELRKVQAIVVVVSTLTLFFFGLASPASAPITKLFFSEYIEGSSDNKALEIYNGTGAAIDLAAEDYSIEIYFDGSISPRTTVALTGTVADEDVYVVADSGADSSIIAQVDQTSASNFYNGNDAVVLRMGNIVLDVIGQVGHDPGKEWGSGDTSTENNTIRRKADVCVGDANTSDDFDPAVEWDGYPNNTFDGLGAHTVTCDICFIHEIQGSGLQSPLKGSNVVI